MTFRHISPGGKVLDGDVELRPKSIVFTLCFFYQIGIYVTAIAYTDDVWMRGHSDLTQVQQEKVPGLSRSFYSRLTYSA